MTKPQSVGIKLDFHQLRTSYKKGDQIFHEDDWRDNAYIIERGEVEIQTTRNGKSIALVRLGQGEVFGETALLGPGRRTATAIATEDTEVFTIPPNILRDRIMSMDPIVGLLMSLLVNRYRQWRYRSPEEAESTPFLPKEEEGLAHRGQTDDFFKDLNHQKQIALKELRMAQEITTAIQNNEFIPYIQPIVSLPDQKIMGFEALIRWHHPERGMIPPMEFIPVAERTHVVWALDMLMLRKACEIAPRLQKMAGNIGRKIYVSVNPSGVHFDSENFAEQIGEIVRQSGVDPAHIVLEITESALMGDPLVAEKVLCEIKKHGLTIALDDFGTGYSSLSYLHRFSIDVLKIDRSFVQGLHANRKCLDIVRAIASLAKNFNLKVVAEGIESPNEIMALAGIGCDYGQGYHFSKPLPLEMALEFVKDSVARCG